MSKDVVLLGAAARWAAEGRQSFDATLSAVRHGGIEFSVVTKMYQPFIRSHLSPARSDGRRAEAFRRWPLLEAPCRALLDARWTWSSWSLLPIVATPPNLRCDIVLASAGRVASLTSDVLLRDQIVSEVNRCGNDVRRALEQVAKFSVLGHNESVDHVFRIELKRQWYKLEWRFIYHGNVEAIRGELASATQRLTAYLVVSNA